MISLKQLSSATSLIQSQSNFRLLQQQTETILKQLKGVCKIINCDDYNKKLPHFYNASVGGHTRHILDHMNQVLIVGNSSHSVTNHEDHNHIFRYDIRLRNTEIETDMEKAHKHCDTLLSHLSELMSVTEQFDQLQLEIPPGNYLHSKSNSDISMHNNYQEVYTLHTTVEVEFMANSVGDTYRLPSTVSRELSFVTHHGVHHLSTIELMMDAMKYANSDDDIGIANSTLHSNQQQQPK